MTTTATNQLNDVEIATVGSLIDACRREPATAETVWSATVHWKGGFASEAKVRDFDPIASDEPAGLGGTDTAPNPVEQLLGALGNCLAVGYAANATATGIELTGLRIDLDGDLNLETFLGIDDGHAGYDAIRVRVHVESDAEPEKIDELHRKVVASSPVGHTLTRAIPVEVVLS